MREQITAWPVVDIRTSEVLDLAMKDRGGSGAQEAETLRLKFRAMPTAALKALDHKPCRREELLPAMVEAACRGLLDPTGEAKLLELLEAEEKARRQREEDRRFASRHAGLTSAEVESLTGGTTITGGEPGPLHLTDEEAEQLRFHGHDPRIIRRMGEVRNLDDYRRVVAEVEGGSR